MWLKLVTAAIGFVVSIVAIVYFIQYLPAQTLDRIQENWQTFLTASLVLSFAYCARGLKSVVLIKEDDCSQAAIAFSLYVSIALNNVFPFRSGDVFRLAYLNRVLGVGLGKTVVVLLLERVVDLITILILFTVFLSIFYHDTVFALTMNMIATVGWSVVTMATLFVAACCLVAYLSKGWIMQRVNALLARRYYTRREVVVVAVTSLIQWVLEILVLGFVVAKLVLIDANQLHIASTFLCNLSTLIPSAPGYVGTFEVAGALPFLIENQDVSELEALFIVVLHLSIWIFSTVLGMIFLPFLLLSSASKLFTKTVAETRRIEGSGRS